MILLVILVATVVRKRSGRCRVLQLQVMLGHGDRGRPRRGNDHLLLELLVDLKIRQPFSRTQLHPVYHFEGGHHAHAI